MKFTIGQVCMCAGLIVVAVFAVWMMHLNWLPCDEPSCMIEPATQAAIGAVLFSGVIVASAILLGAGVIARAVAMATHRSADDAERVSSHVDPRENRPGD